LIENLERITLRGIRPDLTLILDLPAETGLARASDRQARKGEGTDRFEEEDLSFHQALRQAYLAIARSAPGRCVVINADQNPEEVEAAVWAAVRERLPQLARSAVRPLDVA
jgi:dTMP kinase